MLQGPLASSDAFSLFPDQEGAGPEIPHIYAAPRWEDLAGGERQQYLERAEHELAAIHVGSGIVPKPKLIGVRAQNLYLAARKGTAPEGD